MADEPVKGGSWWATIPGILTASAAVITAATGLLAILAQNGVLGEKNKMLVSEKSAAVREVVAPATPSSSSDTASPATKPVPSRTSPPNPAATTSDSRASAASGIVSAPLRAVPFTGAVVTLLDGSVVKLRGDVKESYGGAALKTEAGQAIEMQRMRGFELSDWNGLKGAARITLNNGDVIDARLQAYTLSGHNDLGDFSTTFDKIRSVDFVR